MKLFKKFILIQSLLLGSIGIVNCTTPNRIEGTAKSTLNFSQWTLTPLTGKYSARKLIVPVTSLKGTNDELMVIHISELLQKNVIVSMDAARLISHTAELTDIKIVAKKMDEIFSILETSPDTYALITISELTPALRVLPVNGSYFYDKNQSYPLMFYSRNGTGSDEQKNLFTFAQSGVTALTRGMIPKAEEAGNALYLSEKISPFLKSFDLTHTSNEVSFTPDCTFVPKTMFFCSPLSYFSILKDSGIDIIELTGNHNNDMTTDDAVFTINLYRKNNIRYFGGGLNNNDANKILYIKTGRGKTALIGYNFANVYYNIPLALATSNQPGANPYDEKLMKKDIAEARKRASTVIVDFQFVECYSYKSGSNDDCYDPLPDPDQKLLFRRAIDLGADIVVGTQAHQPQIIERYKHGMIFYGLGNLFFDQIRWEGTRQGMILTHVFYGHRYLNTIVHPTYYDERMQVEITTGKKRGELLDIYYQRKK